MYKMSKLTKISVSEEDANERLDSFLADYYENFSRSQIQKLIENDKILVNGGLKKNSYKLRENDVISINLEDAEKIEILPENIPLDIKYEDDNILVINKPKNMLTHPTHAEHTGTLVNALLCHCGGNLSDLNGELRRGIVHRLDRNTSGLLIAAKNNEAHANIAAQIKERSVIKKYLAVVQGVVSCDEGVIDAPIARNPKHKEKMCVFLMENGKWKMENNSTLHSPHSTLFSYGKPSTTEYKVLERFKNHTLLELNLITGRTHQIRVHLASIGHPVMNDSMYGAQKSKDAKVKTTEQVLQSYHLTFRNPADNNIIDIQIEPDEDIQKVLKYLRSIK